MMDFLKDLFIYLRGGGAKGERENPQADSLLSVEPSMGFNPTTHGIMT